MSSQSADSLAGTGSDLGEREAVRTLLGRNPERYLRTYDRMKAAGRLRVFGWCWSGLVFGATFAFYRRLYPTLLAVEGTFPQERSDVTDQMFGIRLQALIGGSWTGLALAHLTALGLSLAGAVFLLRRMVTSPQPGTAPSMATSPGAASS